MPLPRDKAGTPKNARGREAASGRRHRADARRWMVNGAALALAGCVAIPGGDEQAALAAAGDVSRGREVFISREGGHCVLCHAAPGVIVAGNVAPPLAGVGARLNAAQLRFRVADITRLNPDAAMPAFHRTEGLERVASAYAGRPVLDAQQVEDVVAYLSELR